MQLKICFGSRLSWISVAAALAGCAAPTNFYVYKQSLISYHDSGRYDRDVQAVAKHAMNYIHRRAASGETNLAVVLDIDDTALSTWDRLIKDDFARKNDMFFQWIKTNSPPPIAPILDLYRKSKALGMKVFFVTGRNPALAAQTKIALAKAGYNDPDGIIYRPVEDNRHASMTPFKSGARRALIEQGFRIVANIGDQESDLAGGYAERGFKIPNPFYYTP